MKTKTEIFISDVHVPDHDVGACQVALQITRFVKPDIITFGGDIADLEGASYHLHPPDVTVRLSQDIHSVRDWLQTWRDAFPKAQMRFIEGNHEHRIQKFLWSNAACLAAFPDLSTKALLNLQNMRMEYFANGERFKIGRLWHGHGDQFRIGMGSVNPAVLLFRKYFANIICGHFHRICLHFQTALNDTHGVWINGCLQKLHPDYDKEANWQQGISIINYSEKGFFHVTQVPIINGKAFYAGKLFQAR